ncbi:MAG: peptidyl-prolyl cis-trans isomerase [Candidatus Omnitrophica bacterium]|jgi:peptidyl-prolyl cis-trans isomerase C|nr:peptidyl-prolyl cis-trans isomerase [Candidatus Omnitrophota bacterium]
MRKAFPVVTLIFLIAVFIGCDKVFPPKPAETNEEVAIHGALLARVNSWAIGLDDFKNYLRSIEPIATQQNINVNSTDFKIKFLNDLIKNQILAQIATEKGIDKSDDIARALRDTRDTLLAAKIRKDIEKSVTVSYAEVRAFYDKNKEFFKEPRQIKIREIAVNSEADAKNIYVRLLTGEDFEKIARQESVAPSRDKGGDRGWLTPSLEDLQKNAKFWAAIATVEPGRLSNYFKADDGKYYIIKVEEAKGGGEVSFADVEKKLEDALREDKTEQEVNKLIESFKAKARVEKSEDLLK